MFTSKLMLPIIFILVFAYSALYFSKKQADITIDIQEAKLRVKESINKILQAKAVHLEKMIQAFEQQQDELNKQLAAQAKARSDAEAKLNEVLNDESVKNWGDELVPVAVGRLFNERHYPNHTATAGVVSAGADVSANPAAD